MVHVDIVVEELTKHHPLSLGECPGLVTFKNNIMEWVKVCWGKRRGKTSRESSRGSRGLLFLGGGLFDTRKLIFVHLLGQIWVGDRGLLDF